MIAECIPYRRIFHFKEHLHMLSGPVNDSPEKGLELDIRLLLYRNQMLLYSYLMMVVLCQLWTGQTLLIFQSRSRPIKYPLVSVVELVQRLR